MDIIIDRIKVEELAHAIRQAISESDGIRKIAVDGFCARFSNVFIAPEDVAKMYEVGIATVRRYIDDGFIPIEPHEKNERYRIRLSDALRLDFKEMKKQLKLKKS